MSWAIVITADELESLLLANVAWHLATGASAVHVYLDRPDDPVAEKLRKIHGVQVTLCDDAHWNRLNKNKGRPVLQMSRQSLNANDALKNTTADWLVHLDADEFLNPTGNLALEFQYVRELDVELHFPAWERAYVADQPITGLFDGVMRGSTKGRHRHDGTIFKDNDDCLNLGMIGHAAGKCAVPTNSNFILGVHWSFRGKRGPKNRSERYGSQAARLYHFDGLTPLHWVIKSLRYASHDPDDLKRLVSDSRLAQIQRLLKTGGDRAAGQRLHDALRLLDAPYLDRLEGFGLLDRQGFNPLPKIQSILPDYTLPTAKEWDAQILERYPDMANALIQS